MSDINANIEELFPELRGILDNWETGTPAANGNGNLNGFENENGVEPTDIEQAMQRRMAAMPFPQFQTGQSAPPPPAAHVEDGGGPQQQQQTQQNQPPPGEPIPAPQSQQPPQQPPPPETEQVIIGQNENGTPITVPISRLQAYAQFDEEFQSDSGLRQAVLDYYAQQGLGSPVPPTTGVGTEMVPQSPPAPQPSPSPTYPAPFPDSQPQVPPGVDIDDPNVQFLVQQNQQLQQQIQMLAGGVQHTVQQQQAREQAEHNSMINRAMTSFKDQRGLDDTQMETVRMAAARLNVLPSLMAGVDPITGTPTKPDPLTALDRAFEIAYMQIPEFRTREFGRVIQQRVTDNRRKQKLAGLSGSSGSVPRTSPAPTDAPGRRAAMIDEIRQMQNGEWSPPES